MIKCPDCNSQNVGRTAGNHNEMVCHDCNTLFKVVDDRQATLLALKLVSLEEKRKRLEKEVSEELGFKVDIEFNVHSPRQDTTPLVVASAKLMAPTWEAEGARGVRIGKENKFNIFY